MVAIFSILDESQCDELLFSYIRVYRSVGKYSNLGGHWPQMLNRVDLYGKSLIPMEDPGSYAYAGIALLGFCNIDTTLPELF